MKILSTVGARPNFMKIAPIISAVNKYNANVVIGAGKSRNNGQDTVQHVLVHTGQHYDKNMSDIFFKELDLPEPDIYLGVGSGSHAKQTSEIMEKYEAVLLEEAPDVVIVVGDVNSTLACALVASKITFRQTGTRPLIAHIEAGLRSFDRSMPEEVNRILTDHVSDMLFVTEQSGIENLTNEGIPEEKIYFVGNTMIDTLLLSKKKALKSAMLRNLGLASSKSNTDTVPFALLTLHRPGNVDNGKNFLEIIEALKEISRRMPVIFPAHPRTIGRIKNDGLSKHFRFYPGNKGGVIGKKIGSNKGINLIEPLGYLDFLSLMMQSKMVLTDSGGIQEETTCLGIPCVTIRNNTERPVTVREGTNIIAGVEKKGIVDAINYQFNNNFRHKMPKHWDGKAAIRILNTIMRKAKQGLWGKS